MKNASLRNQICDLLRLGHKGKRMLQNPMQCVWGGHLLVARHLPRPCSFPEIIPEYAIGDLPALNPIIDPPVEFPEYRVDVARIRISQKIIPWIIPSPTNS